MTDQTFREIQLSGKQLVFAFMASLVVLVAVFLLGVSVGRGVRQSLPPGTDVAASEPVAPATMPPPTQTKQGDLTYHDKLPGQASGKPSEAPPPATEPATPPTPAPPAAANTTKPVEPPPANPLANPPAAATTAPPTGSTAKPPAPPAAGGYILQMGLFNSRENAQNLAADLKKSGYPTVIAPSGKAFVVRVGPYADRAEAERMQAKLQRERGTKPLIQSR